MSSISAQGVVERASAELSKRINGLGLRSSKPHVAKGTSVMERVTNVFCGGGGSNNAAYGAPEKPSRLLPSRGLLKSNFLSSSRKARQPPQHLYLDWPHLMMDERFLTRFFLYFSARDRCTLAQVCTRWRDILYRSPHYWSGLMPVLQCRELRGTTEIERARLYASLLVKGFYTLCLMGASDEDAMDLVNTFPLASEHIHTLSLRCSSITDRGLETLLDHLQALYELELAGCNEITEAGLWACLNPRIVSLTLTDCINVADEAVGAVAQLLPALYEFSLQAYHVTDAALTYFSPKQQYSIGVLRLHSCWEITSQGVITIAATMKNLTVLSLSGCSKITDEALEAIAEFLKGLKSLDLSWCPRITDHGLENIACDLNQLEELILDRCINLTDNGISFLCTMLSLSSLYLRWCSQIGDGSMQHIVAIRKLQILSLAGCPLLTCSGLSTLIQLRHLKELELTNCPGASRELFDYLREHLPRCLIIE